MKKILPLLFLVATWDIAFSQDLLTYLDSSGQKRQVQTLYDWELKRDQILDSMQALFGNLPEVPDRPPFPANSTALPAFNPQVKDSLITDTYVRYDISFTVAAGEEVTAYLYLPLPRDGQKKFPAMLALQPTGALGRKIVDGQGPRPNRAYGKELAERGYIVIAPDYPSFGEQQDHDFANDRYESGVMKAIFNHIRSVDFLQARKDVDPERIGVIGHSLGGHSAMYVAAFDTRLKVIVSSCGWTLRRYYNNYNEAMRKKFGSRLWGSAQERYTPLALTKYNLRLEAMPFDFDELIAVLAPRPFFSNSPIHDANFNVEGVRKGIANASRVYHFLQAEENLQVRYPIASHDFPTAVRLEAYRFIDKILMHDPRPHTLE